MKKTNIRAAVIGLGVGSYHVSTYLKNKNSVLESVCDLEPKKFNQIKKTFPKISFSKNAKEIYQKKNINLVSVASYDNFHFEQIINLLNNKKNIFVEKPLCTNPNQLKKIFKLLKLKKKKLNCNFVLRGVPEFIQLKRIIDQGKLGKIYYIEGDYNYGRLHKITKGWRSKLRNYSVTLGGTIHLIDLILWLTKKNFLRVISEGNNISTKNSNFRQNDLVTSLIKMRDKSIVKLTANFGSKAPHHHLLKIYGTKGMFCKTLGGSYYSFSNNPQKKISYKKENKKKYYESKQKVLNNFINDLFYRRKLSMTHDEIYRAMEVAFLIDKSLKSKKWEHKI